MGRVYGVNRSYICTDTHREPAIGTRADDRASHRSEGNHSRRSSYKAMNLRLPERAAARSMASGARLRHHGGMDELIVGFDRTTLRPTVDLARARTRLHELGDSRSLTALMERARILAALGEFDRAAALAASAVVQARTSGLRENALRARLLRASVADARGLYDRAAREATKVIEEARSADVVEVWARALQLRGITHFERGQWREAVDDFSRALALHRDYGAAQRLVDESEVSLLVASDRLAQETNAIPKRAAHPLFG